MRTIRKSELMAMLGDFISVKNTPSRNGHSEAPNQFQLRFEHGQVFQSYQALVGAKIGGQLYVTKYHDYSKTTSQHMTKWCGYDTKERRDMLESGRIIFVEG